MKQCMQTLQEKLRELGLRQGDMLYVASDVLYLLYEAKERYGVESAAEQDSFLNELVDALQHIVGPTGTLLFPVFTWAFCRGNGYDSRSTKGETGALGNFILAHRKDFQRTQHPLYSFMVWGKEAQNLVALDNIDAWAGGTPFDYLLTKKGKMLLLHVTAQKCLTYIHYVEECIKVPYRYRKEFHGEYTDMEGKVSKRTYSQFVRDLDIEMSQCMPDDFLTDKGAAKKVSWENAPVWLVDVPKACAVIEEDLLHNNGENCYTFKNYRIDWSGSAK